MEYQRPRLELKPAIVIPEPEIAPKVFQLPAYSLRDTIDINLG